jgi:dipicolinate synthase subunit A
MLHNSSYVLGPIPFFQDGYVKNTSITAEEIKSSLHAGQHVFGGNLPKTLTDALEARGIYCHDYMKNEEIAIFNSIATAEGLIADIVTSYPGNLYKSRIVVLGYGKCARTLADRLKGLGCLVTVCARCENALALAYSLGHDTLTLDELNLYAPQFDIIINTIPALVVTKDTLQRITKKTFIYDIASKPGGVDFDTAKLLGLHASLHLSLPGKYAPKASGEALYHFIFKELKDYISE